MPHGDFLYRNGIQRFLSESKNVFVSPTGTYFEFIVWKQQPKV